MNLLRRATEAGAAALRGRELRIHPSISDWELMGLALDSAGAAFRGMWKLPGSHRDGLLFLGRDVRLANRAGMHFGRSVRLGDHVFVRAAGSGISFGHNVSIGAFSRVVVSTSLVDPAGEIRIGDNVGIGEFAYLGGAGGLEIGSDTISGQYLSIHPENHRVETDALIREQGVTRKGIRIGKDCWIGAKVTILDGVTIGDHSIIAAGSVVTRSFERHSVIAGVPARLLKRRK